MPILTIAIPTYNRATQLARRLREIERQWTAEVVIRVFDNASTDHTANVVQEFTARMPVRYWRSEVNLGAVRNVIRCFEDSDTEWVWPLSDDDGLTDTAIAEVLARIAATKADAINFSSHCGGNPADLLLSTPAEFFRVKHDPCSLALISATVYRRSTLKPAFKILFSSAFTLIPHAVLILTMLDRRLGKLELVARGLTVSRLSRNLRWSSREYSLGVSLLPEFLTEPDDQRQAAAGLRAATRWMLFFALREVQTQRDARQWKRTVRQVDANLRFYGGTKYRAWRRDHYPRWQQFKQVTGICFVRLLPNNLLQRFARLLRQRWHIEETTGEFSETALPRALSGAASAERSV